MVSRTVYSATSMHASVNARNRTQSEIDIKHDEMRQKLFRQVNGNEYPTPRLLVDHAPDSTVVEPPFTRRRVEAVLSREDSSGLRTCRVVLRCMRVGENVEEVHAVPK